MILIVNFGSTYQHYLRQKGINCMRVFSQSIQTVQGQQFQGANAQKTKSEKLNQQVAKLLFGHKQLKPQSASDRFATEQMLRNNYSKFIPPFAPPKFNDTFHKQRRKLFMEKFEPNTTVIITGNNQPLRNSDVTYKFRQDSDFYYMTGFDEPDAVAILSNDPQFPEYTLVVPPRDALRETWDGKRAGIEGAVKAYGADKAYNNTDLNDVLSDVMKRATKLRMVTAPTNKALTHRLKTLEGLHRHAQRPIKPVRDKIHELRIIKTPYEQALLKRAVQISMIGHAQAMKNLKLTPHLQKKYQHLHMGLNEGVIQAEIEKPFRQHGAVRVGYETIGGSGANACVLHYITNNDYAKSGDLVLIDAGAEYGYYTADITRTWPVSGKFSPAQKAIYDIVYEAQESGIQMVKPGVTLADIHKNSVNVITKGLMELGIIKGDANDPEAVEASIKNQDYRKYFMHGTSHMMGLDVHDMQVPSEDGSRAFGTTPLEAGMVFTVEPGIYIDPKVAKAEGLDEKWWGIGVRIEDDVMCTATGVENLSEELPRTTEEIEAMMAGRSKLPQTINLEQKNVYNWFA